MSELLPITHPAATSHACGEASLAPLPQPPASEGAGIGVGGGRERHTIFTPQAQGAFLENLSHSGNVRLACRVAGVSPQTAYRARRKSVALARAWDAALVSARHNAEEVLADRALNGWEEAVFYHGEEVAVRRRYSDRLLLAHLARLDKLAERGDVADALAALDDQIDALQRGEELSETVRSEPVEDLHFTANCASEESAGGDPAGQLRSRQACPEHCRRAQPKRVNEGVEKLQQDPVPCVPSGRTPSTPIPEPCPQCGGLCNGPEHALTRADCQWFGNRLNRMWDARPHGVPAPHEQGDTTGFIEELQIEAFEADLPEWWLITTEDALDAALEAAIPPA